MANLIDLIGRILISALFLLSAYNKIFSIDGTMSWMEGFGVPGFLLYPSRNLTNFSTALKCAAMVYN